MRIAIHQPETLPWPGFFWKVLQSDILVLLDDVQFSKNNVQNRNVLVNAGAPSWYTVPIKKDSLSQNINEVEINKNDKGIQKFKNKLHANYESIYSHEIEKYLITSDLIVDFNINIIRMGLNQLGWRNKVVKSSQLSISSKDRVGRLIEITKQMNASIYVSGLGAQNYGQISIFIFSLVFERRL